MDCLFHFRLRELFADHDVPAKPGTDLLFHVTEYKGDEFTFAKTT